MLDFSSRSSRVVLSRMSERFVSSCCCCCPMDEGPSGLPGPPTAICSMSAHNQTNRNVQNHRLYPLTQGKHCSITAFMDSPQHQAMYLLGPSDYGCNVRLLARVNTKMITCVMTRCFIYSTAHCAQYQTSTLKCYFLSTCQKEKRKNNNFDVKIIIHCAIYL